MITDEELLEIEQAALQGRGVGIDLTLTATEEVQDVRLAVAFFTNAPDLVLSLVAALRTARSQQVGSTDVRH